ncbi:hypothetical protein RUM44_009957 [Polyplax serrata]|uniref:F5/8 type C domain-containing protein n=1 Tax=Polyplax serrata TaxID=468196 RepID=A0ABR1AU49_POLSC
MCEFLSWGLGLMCLGVGSVWCVFRNKSFYVLHDGVRTELHGGAWCPKEQTTTDPKEWLEINLHRVHVITATETQGRFGNGQGMEYAEAYILEYWRPKIGKWVRYRNINGTEKLRNQTRPVISLPLRTVTSPQEVFQVL